MDTEREKGFIMSVQKTCPQMLDAPRKGTVPVLTSVINTTTNRMLEHRALDLFYRAQGKGKKKEKDRSSPLGQDVPSTSTAGPDASCGDNVEGRSSVPVTPAATSSDPGAKVIDYDEAFPPLPCHLESRDKKVTTGTKEKGKTGDGFPTMSASSSRNRSKDSASSPVVEKAKTNTEAERTNASGKCKPQLSVESPLQEPTTTSCSAVAAPSTHPVNAQNANRDSKSETLIEMIRPKFNFPSAKPGTAGRSINLITNHFDLKCGLRYIYHYDVTISEVKTSRRNQEKRTRKLNSDNYSRLEKLLQANVNKKLCQEIFAKFLKLCKENKNMEKIEPVYDGGKNLYTSRKLPIRDQLGFNVPLEVDGKIKQYKVTLKPVKKLDGTNIISMHSLQNVNSYNPDQMTEVLLLLNTIMNHRSTDSSEIKIGRSFFCTRGSQRIDVGEGLEIWRGYNESVHLTEKGPTVVLNLSARIFHKAGEAIAYINELLDRDVTFRNRPLNTFELKKIRNALANVRVRVTHLSYPRQYRINGVTDLPAQDLKMQIDGNEVSIAQYFSEKYGNLKFPHLHCFKMRSSNNRTFVPFEKCLIVPGQPKAGTNDELSKKVTAEMMKKTAILPAERFEGISKYVKQVNETCAAKMKEFQLFMDLTPKRVKGRVLDAPALRYSSGRLSCPKNGTWSIAGQRFIKAKRFESWIIVNFTESQPNLKKFSTDLRNLFYHLGLYFNEFKGVHTYGNDTPAEVILNKPEVRNSSLVVIVLSRENYHNYDEIKFIADYCLGIVTQCVLDTVLSRNDISIFTNICLKINTKLGGVNHELADRPKVLREPVIILGIDVVHSTLCPSIAAVVGSMDPHVSAYKVCCRVQENEKQGKKSQEIILELENMVEIILDGFLKYTGGIQPRKILCYRDGVSDGQFGDVGYYEVSSIQRASEKVLGKVVPLTFMVVQKRHQTRLRTENPKDGVGRGLNIPPGTTVDTDITYPNSFDFFLCSHEGLQGTSKPSRYTILHDDNRFDTDELQKFTYDLCHLYGRCTKSVSIPAPVKYADLAAYRAKKYADFQLKKRRNCSGRSSDLPQYALDAINNMEASKNHMFFI